MPMGRILSAMERILNANGENSKCQWGGRILNANGGRILNANGEDCKCHGEDSKCQWGGM